MGFLHSLLYPKLRKKLLDLDKDSIYKEGKGGGHGVQEQPFYFFDQCFVKSINVLIN